MRWLTEADVVATVDLLDAIDAVEDALVAESRGKAHGMEKTHVAWGDGHTLHAIGAVDETDGLVATKTWAHTGGGATPLVVLWDANDGTVVAIVEAFALGQLRTGAMTGVATRWLAPEHATRAALVGTGKQAIAQLAAMAAVCTLDEVRVHSPSADHRRAFVEAARALDWSFDIVDAETVVAATRDAHVVTTATRARTAFLHRADVDDGALVNAIGAITPERAELSHDLVARADLLVADSTVAAERLATELAGRSAKPLHEVVGGGHRRPPATLTIFKAMGVGLADLAIARLAWQRSIEEGRGANIAQPLRASPRLRRT